MTKSGAGTTIAVVGIITAGLTAICGAPVSCGLILAFTGLTLAGLALP